MEIKRLAIYAFFDKHGVADEYNFYLLNKLKKHINELTIVIIGKINKEDRIKFENIAENVIAKENKGFDTWAYKEGLDFHGPEYLEKFDEVILLNSTFFGPLYPFSEMFETMDKKNIDFWGITMHPKVDHDNIGTVKYKYIPQHIQSYFITIRKKMFTSHDFKRYWRHLKEINTYEEAIGFHEVIFTKHFCDIGFTWDVYIDTKDLKDYAENILIEDPYKLIKDYRCPVLKRRNLYLEYSHMLNISCGQTTFLAFNYIKENLDYDTNLILENILRTENQYDLYNNLCLKYILPSERKSQELKSNKKVLLILCLYYEDLVEYCYNYAKNVPEFFDILIVINERFNKSNIEEMFSKIKCNKLMIRTKPNIGRDVSSIYTTAKDIVFNYDLICYLHDKKTLQIKPFLVGESFMYKCFDNLLKTKDYILNIIDLFESENKLGFLSPTPPYHAQYYTTLGHGEWGINYKPTLKLHEKLNLNVDITKSKPPIAAYGHCFWFRPIALKQLYNLDLEYKDYPEEPLKHDGTLLHALERIEPFVVQENGYFPAYVMNTEFERIESISHTYMLRHLNNKLFSKFGIWKYIPLLNTVNKINKNYIPLNQRTILFAKKIIPQPIKNIIKKIIKKR